MTTTHNSFVNVSLPLDAPPEEQFQWSRIAVLRDSGGNASFLGGLRSKAYDATTAAAATDLDAATKAILAKLFNQSPRPASILVVAYDSAASPDPETPAIAYDALVTEGKEHTFYAMHMVYAPAGGSPSITHVTNLADKLLARDYGILFVDYIGTDVYTGAIADSALNGLEAYENVVVGFCDSATTLDCHTLDAAGRWLSFDPDVATTPMVQPLRGVLALTTPPNSVERLQLLANKVNVVLPFHTHDAFFAPGSCIDGRQAMQVLIRDWLKLGMESDLRAVLLDYALRGEVFPLSQEGLDLGEGILAARLNDAIRLRKVVAGQYVISEGSFNVDTEVISFRVDATNTTAARGFSVTGQLTRNNVV